MIFVATFEVILMHFANIRLPQLLFFYTAIVLAAILCLCMLNMGKKTLGEDFPEWQKIDYERREKINRLAAESGASEEIVAAVLLETDKYGMPPALMLELIKTESGFDPKAISSHGAVGLCQLMPATAREISRELGLYYYDDLLLDPGYNIKLAAYYLSKLLAMHNQDLHKALTAYNRGPAGLKLYIQKTGTAESSYSIRISGGSLQRRY